MLVCFSSHNHPVTLVRKRSHVVDGRIFLVLERDVSVGEVHVNADHVQRAMAQNFLKAEGVAAVHDVLRGEGVAHRMRRDADALNAGLSAQAGELLAEQMAASPAAETDVSPENWSMLRLSPK